MANNTIKARMQLKYDTEANWNKAIHFCPLRGEVIIYAADDTRHFCRLKVGDGETPVVDLPFIPFYEETGDRNAKIKSHDSAYWRENANYIPTENELIIYNDYQQLNPSQYLPGIKIGDGTTYVADLPFIDAMLQTHINDTTIHVTPEEKGFWNNKINCEDNVDNETLLLNRR